MKQPQIADSGRVVASQAAALDTKHSAAYLDCSASWLAQARAADVKRAARAEPMTGPRWVLLPFGVRYLRADLDSWIASSAVPLAVQESARRERKAE